MRTCLLLDVLSLLGVFGSLVSIMVISLWFQFIFPSLIKKQVFFSLSGSPYDSTPVEDFALFPLTHNSLPSQNTFFFISFFCVHIFSAFSFLNFTF